MNSRKSRTSKKKLRSYSSLDLNPDKAYDDNNGSDDDSKNMEFKIHHNSSIKENSVHKSVHKEDSLIYPYEENARQIKNVVNEYHAKNNTNPYS